MQKFCYFFVHDKVYIYIYNCFKCIYYICTILQNATCDVNVIFLNYKLYIFKFFTHRISCRKIWYIFEYMLLSIPIVQGRWINRIKVVSRSCVKSHPTAFGFDFFFRATCSIVYEKASFSKERLSQLYLNQVTIEVIIKNKIFVLGMRRKKLYICEQ